jgi:signal transduction histidine kinase
MFRITARTVLELGAELISSDMIAFYELIKNAFDAKSGTGADVYFNVVFRRNDYVEIRAQAEQARAETRRRSGGKDVSLIRSLIDLTEQKLDRGASSELISSFLTTISAAENLPDFIDRLDEAYRSLNSIQVVDSGTGMSLRELNQNFMTIGTPSRKKEIEAALRHGGGTVPYLGEKGIGRLSAMRLGDRLRVETARTEDQYVNILDVDWKAFSDLDAMVEDIKFEPKRGSRKPKPDYHGTKLVISDLSEDWTEKRLRDLAEFHFARLTDPFVDPKLRPRIALYWNGNRVTIPWMDPTLIENAHAWFRGEYKIVNGEPVLRVQMEARNLGYDHPREVEVATRSLPDLEGLLRGTSQELPFSALTSVGPFEFEAYWYNRRSLGGIDTIGNQKAVRELQKRWSGILLFRDRFRVFPYGDDEDDWLGLDRKALGRPGYVLNKAQFVGHVKISRSGNRNLVDQTNREGLRATAEQSVFVAILQHVVRDMLWDFFRDIDRRYKKSKVEIGDLKGEINTLESRARTALSKVKGFVPKGESAVYDDLQYAFNEFKDLSARAQQRIEEVEEDSRQMIQMAGVGLMVEVVAHELARASESALEALEGLRGKDMPTEVKARLETLRAEMKSVSKRLRILDQLSVSGRQRSEVFDLGELLTDLKDGHVGQFQRHKVTMNISAPKGSLRIRAVKGMVVQILENLVSNSIYWMDIRAARESRFTPTINVEVSMNPPTIYFSDNGRGVSPEHREQVFRPFWSLKEKSKRRGLGLFIARENAQYLGGTLILSNEAAAETGRLHTFILELPSGAIVQ